MARGLIEGKDARIYDKRKKSERSNQFDKFILENITLPKPRICDLCCGSGNMIELLHEKANEIVGVDASEEMIKICKEKFEKKSNVKLLHSSATELDLESKYFDYVIIRDGLHHLKDKVSVLKETLRILKPKGKLILVDRFYENIMYYYIKEYLNLIFKFDKHILNHFILSKKENLELLKRFKVVKQKYPIEPPKKTTQAFMFVLEK